ncbi:hypothetical protein BSI_13300 [Bacillus inaquosorum KCTC 13429]|uniref:Uncharacterized protein n=1 Tax=Bacillus inaquosorum KCTC 13429 TaxID=1236548 RepID=A0A9W5PE32_9BACI|nr:hypothetical protein BSI_13300 [Bacillus inaquosorum KCTC 13429]
MAREESPRLKADPIASFSKQHSGGFLLNALIPSLGSEREPALKDRAGI